MAQRVSFSMAARLDVETTIHSATIDHFAESNTYLIDDTPFFDTPSVLPLFAKSEYQFKLDFAAFHDNSVITPGNYQDKGYLLKVKTQDDSQPSKTQTLSQEDNLPAFSLNFDEPGSVDAKILVELYKDNKLAANAVFPFDVVPTPDPSDPVTMRVPFKYNLQSATLQMFERGNTRNRINTDITFGTTIAVQEGKEYLLGIMMEKTFMAGTKELSLSINGKQDFGHRVEFEWQGPALPLKLRTENGMYAYLTVAPPVAPIAITAIEAKEKVAVAPQPMKEVTKVPVSPKAMEKAEKAKTAKISEKNTVKEMPAQTLKVKPSVTVKDLTIVRRFDKNRLQRPIKVEEVKEIEISAFEKAIRKNPELLKVQPISPEISEKDAELAAGTPVNTYTLLIHLINEFGEEDASPKPVTFVVLRK